MYVRRHPRFEKSVVKLSRKKQEKVRQAVKLLTVEPSTQCLRLHQLKGEYYPQYSISAGGDLRIHFLQLDDNTILLMLVGTHAQLY